MTMICRIDLAIDHTSREEFEQRVREEGLLHVLEQDARYYGLTVTADTAAVQAAPAGDARLTKGQVARLVSDLRSSLVAGLGRRIEEQETAIASLRNALRLGYHLSTYAASIRWSPEETNQPEWLSEFRDLIEAFQPVAEQCLEPADAKAPGIMAAQACLRGQAA